MSDRGLKVLSENPVRIDRKFLERFEEFREFKSRKRVKNKDKDVVGGTPTDNLEFYYKELKQKVVDELLSYMSDISPFEFERIIGKVLSSLGYGVFSPTSKTRDGGFDGILTRDKLGLEKIFIQVKRFKDSVVSRQDVQKFSGALDSKKSNLGVFITLSSFSKDAEEYVKLNNSKNIVLIDGLKLAELMFDNDVGVEVDSVFYLKRVDKDFFEL